MTRPSARFAMLPLLASALLAGCGRDVSPEAWALLEGGKDAFRTGDNPAAVGKLDAFLKDNAGSKLAGEAYFFRGRARLAMGDRGGAGADLAQAAALLQDKLMAAQSLVYLGEIVEEGGDLAGAERLYRQGLDKLELGQKPADDALYRLGGVIQKQGRWADADLPLDRLIYLFHDSPLARQAERKVRCAAWTIRTAVFFDRPAAAAAAEELARAGLVATIREVLEEERVSAASAASQTSTTSAPSQSGKRLAFWVQVGRYANYAQAAAALPAVRAKAKDAAIVETR